MTKVRLDLAADLADLANALKELPEAKLVELVKDLVKDMDDHSLDLIEAYVKTLEG